jgi:hypothetical protein
MRISYWVLVVGALAVAGCGRGGKQAESSKAAGGTPGHPDSSAMGMGHMDSGGMKMGRMDSGGGMGMGPGMPGMQMMAGMRAHMDSMMRMSPQRMQAMMATHEAMMAQMLDRMGGDMRGMHMAGSREWNALTDSVKQDLAELPNLKGQALAARMRAHAARVERLMAMHEKMMAK